MMKLVQWVLSDCGEVAAAAAGAEAGLGAPTPGLVVVVGVVGW